MAFILKWPSLFSAVHLSILVSLVWDVCACTRRIFFLFFLLLFSIRDGRDGESPIACGDSGRCHRHHIYRLSVILSFSLLWSQVLVTECCQRQMELLGWVVAAFSAQNRRKERRTRSEGRGDGHHHHHHHYLVCGHKASALCSLFPSLREANQSNPKLYSLVVVFVVADSRRIVVVNAPKSQQILSRFRSLLVSQCPFLVLPLIAQRSARLADC